MNYVFLCKNCSPTGLESFKKNQARMYFLMCVAIVLFTMEFFFLFFSEFTQMCITTIANLMQNSTKEGKSRQYFSRDREIVPYIESHWEYIVSDDISKGLNGQIHHHVFNFVV
jgi:Set1/Ash2 histone methyltransferase complex subunit ASH2